jgi:two-component system sensor histidine kinase DesK
VTVADDRRDRGLPAAGGAGHSAAGAEHVLAPRLARLVLALALLALSMQAVVDAVSSPTGAPVAVVSVAVIVVLMALQLYHSSAAWRGARPRDWAWTLSVQLLLTSLGFLPVLHSAIHTLGGFVAGSALLLLSARAGWTAFAGIQVAIAAHHMIGLPGLDTADILYGMVGTLTTGLVVYGLSRMAEVAVELEEARRKLARMAVVRERLRVAQDTHDLLGLGLSAVALKSDLAARLIGRDDARARRELDALLRLAAQSRADIRAVTTGEHGLSLRTELDAAGEVLASAGITTEVRAEPSGARLPEETDAVLAPYCGRRSPMSCVTPGHGGARSS